MVGVYDPVSIPMKGWYIHHIWKDSILCRKLCYEAGRWNDEGWLTALNLLVLDELDLRLSDLL